MSWRAHPAVRVAGAAIGWFGLAACLTLLFNVALVVMALGGACANGGAYEIAVECPENVAAFAPLSIWGGLISVGVWLFFSGGFGTPLPGWAWFGLFGGLSVPFALAGGTEGWLVAGVFFIMGIVPIGLELRANAARAFLGTRDVNGQTFSFGDNSRRALLSYAAPLDGTVAPNASNWLLGLGVPIAAVALGILAGNAAF